MPNRLNFPGYTVLSDPVTDAIHATYDELPEACPACGVVGASFPQQIPDSLLS